MRTPVTPTNELMLSEIAKSKQLGRPTVELCAMWSELIMQAQRDERFARLDEVLLQEMVQNAILQCLTHGLKFDPEKSDNPIAYYKMVIEGSFCNTVYRERKYA